MKTSKSTSKLLCDAVLNYAAEIMSARCILIHGTDAFQRDKCFKAIIKTLQVPINDMVQSFLYYGDEFPKDSRIPQIMETLTSFSFDMSEKVVTIKNFEQLNKNAIARIADYTENPSSNCKLILLSDKLDGKLNAVKTIVQNCLHFETVEMRYPKDLLLWLTNYLNENNLKMDNNAKTLFSNIVEPDAYTAFNEMRKLQLYIGKTNVITEDDIKHCTISSKKFTVFDLIDAVGYKQKQKAMSIAESLINNEENLILIIVMLSNLFFTLWRLDAHKRNGVSAFELKRDYMKDIAPYFHDKYITFLSNYQNKSITNALKQLYIADFRAKDSSVSDTVLLTNLVYNLMHNQIVL